MATGLFQDHKIVERFTSGAISTGTIAQPYVAPVDYDVIGLIAHLGTAPGGSTSITFNVSVSPTSQIGGSTQLSPNPYNLWTATNVPTITGTAVSNFTVNQTVTLVENIPYALNYPFPGPGGTSGFTTAQSSSSTTSNPVLSPPLVTKFQMNNLVVPDNTYTGYNGITESAATVHAGDVLSFVVGGTAGSSANLQLELVLNKR